MSQVKISGNASGTGIFMIASPNSNTDRTLTLPDQTGTVLTNAGPFTANASASAGAVTIDASNNVGIGTSSPATRLQVTKNAADVARFTNSLSNGGDWEFKIGGGGFEDRKLMITDKFSGADNVRVAIDPSGNLLVGQTTVGLSTANSVSFEVANGRGYFNHSSAQTSGSSFCAFGYNNGLIGSITQNGTTAVAFNTTSDYRLKTNVQPLAGALAKVQALNPCAFDWVDGRADDGFIAHELQAVLPNVVTGKKDAEDDEGRPQYQQVDYARIVPTLTAAIQELSAKVDAQAAEIAALKGAA